MGSGGFGIGIASALGRKASARPDNIDASSGPVLAVSGSCSSLTSDQIEYAQRGGWHTIALDSSGSDSNWALEIQSAALEARREIQAGRSVILYTCGADSPGRLAR